MRHSIPYYIREQLREERSVYIPSLGKFSLIHHSSSYSDDKTTINPPKLSLAFDEEGGNELPLLEKISAVENFTIEKSKKKLSKYTDNIFNKLINLNKVEIEGIGTLERASDEVIRFNETVDQLTDEYQGLNSITLNPIKRMTNSDDGKSAFNQEPLSVSETVATKKSSRPWWIPILGGVILALAYILTMKTCDDNKVGMFGSNENIDLEKEVTNKEDELADAITIEESKVERVIDGESDETNDGVKKNEIAEKTGTPIERIESSDKIKPREVAPTQNEATNKVIVKEQEEIDYSKPANEHSVIQSITYDGTTCIIIVGSFKKPKYALRMMSKVEDLGYKVYSAPYNDFTRVGLQFNCKESELATYINEVRSKIEKGAWYLEKPGK